MCCYTRTYNESEEVEIEEANKVRACVCVYAGPETGEQNFYFSVAPCTLYILYGICVHPPHQQQQQQKIRRATAYACFRAGIIIYVTLFMPLSRRRCTAGCRPRRRRRRRCACCHACARSRYSPYVRACAPNGICMYAHLIIARFMCVHMTTSVPEPNACFLPLCVSFC